MTLDLDGINEDSTEDEDAESSAATVAFNSNYACIVPDFGRIGDYGPEWRLGGGSSKSSSHGYYAGIDILVIQYHQRRKSRVARCHAIIEFHEVSGVLVLTGVCDSHPVVYFWHNEKISLKAGESHVMWQPSNRFQLGNLDFVLKYEETNPEQYATWVATRNALLEAYEKQTPSPKICAIPTTQSFEVVEDIIIHGTLGTGAFGWVKAGVHRGTGFAVAIKRLEIKNASSQRECSDEASTALQLQVSFSFFRCRTSLTSPSEYTRFHVTHSSILRARQ